MSVGHSSPQAVNWLTLLSCLNQAALFIESEWMVKMLASAPGTSARVAILASSHGLLGFLCVFSSGSLEYFWRTRLPSHCNQSSVTWDSLRVFQADDSELVIWWKQRWNIWCTFLDKLLLLSHIWCLKDWRNENGCCHFLGSGCLCCQLWLCTPLAATDVCYNPSFITHIILRI